jgi:hypothetical protein
MFQLKRFAVILAAPVFTALLLSPAWADDEKKEAGKDMVIVGCLSQGEQPDVYQIKTDDKTYVLVGDKALLAKNVGHTVTISGRVDTEREKETAAKPGDVDRFKISSWTKTGGTCP